MDQQLQSNKSELQLVSLQLDRKIVDSKVADITIKELETGGSNKDQIWEGVGKIFMSSSINDYKERIIDDLQTINEQIKALKIKKDYLQTSLEKTIDNMNSIITGGKS